MQKVSDLSGPLVSRPDPNPLPEALARLLRALQPDGPTHRDGSTLHPDAPRPDMPRPDALRPEGHAPPRAEPHAAGSREAHAGAPRATHGAEQPNRPAHHGDDPVSHGTAGDVLRPDRDGWIALDAACEAVGRALSRDVAADELRVLMRSERFAATFGLGIEICGARVRILRGGARGSGHVVTPPDILFHPTTQGDLAIARAAGVLGHRRGQVLVTPDEVAAWRAAHRLSHHALSRGRGRARATPDNDALPLDGVPSSEASLVEIGSRRDASPAVVVIDALRARRAGVRFRRTRSGAQLAATPIPLQHALNLRPGYAEQLSAGGIPLRRDVDGQIRMALVQVTRRSGVTWEVAKGKLEVGETPEVAAVREVREEMGLTVPLRVIRYVGPVRYGFLAPGGLPRLKTIFLYLMVPEGQVEGFAPANAEGIGAVRWFTPEEACKVVVHSSLRPIMRTARDLVAQFGLTPELPAGRC